MAGTTLTPSNLASLQAQAPNTFGAAGSTFNGITPNPAPSSTPAPTTVVTSQPAASNVANMQTGLTTLQNGVASQTQNNQNNQRTAQQQAVLDKTAQLTQDYQNRQLGIQETKAQTDNTTAAAKLLAAKGISGETSTQPVPAYGSTVTDANGNQGTAQFDPNTGQPLTQPTTQTTPTTDQTKTDANNAAKAQYDAEKDAQLKQHIQDLDNLRNGVFPLTAPQQAILTATQNNLQQAVAAQKLANANYEGGITAAGIASGRSRYAPEIEAGNIQAAISAGISKISTLENDASLTMAKLQESFQQEDFAQADKLYTEINDSLNQKTTELQSMNDKIAAAAKDTRDYNYKVQKDLTDGINNIAAEAAKNGADAKTMAAITSAGSVANAISAAGSSLQTATGQLGDYLQYKRDASASGVTPEDYATWKAADDARASKLKVSEAYGTAFATAKGKAAGEAGASGNTPTSPVTSPSGIIYNAPASIAPYVAFTTNGVKYVDLSKFKGTPTEAYKAAQDAQAAGYRVVTNTNSAADLQNITNANLNLDSIQKAFDPTAPNSATARNTYGASLNKLNKFLQTNPDLSAIDTFQDAGLDILKAISGVQGFRGGQSVIQQVKDTLPQITDTKAVVDQKIANIKSLLNNRETALAGEPSASDKLLITEKKNENNLTTNLNSMKTSNPKIYQAASNMYTSINPATGQPYSAADILQAFPELNSK